MESGTQRGRRATARDSQRDCFLYGASNLDAAASGHSHAYPQANAHPARLRAHQHSHSAAADGHRDPHTLGAANRYVLSHPSEADQHAMCSVSVIFPWCSAVGTVGTGGRQERRVVS